MAKEKSTFVLQKANELLQKGIISDFTYSQWRRKNEMPAFYFKGEAFKINGFSLRELLTVHKLKQTEFVELFNKRFGTSIVRQSAVRWMSGKSKPLKDYAKMLKDFFNELEAQKNEIL